MQQKILPPTKVVYKEESADKGTVEIHGCYPGYGSTLGNSLRRVLLSSLEGAAVTSVKIKGAQHEFSTVPGIMEDVVQIILNLKKLRFTLHTDEPVKISLKEKGEKTVTAKSFKTSSDVEVVNTDHVIANLTEKKAQLDMEIEVRKGIGYTPVEQQERESKEIGMIAIDAIYTPIRRVNFDVQNMRVGKQTDYEKVKLDIETDGSISPKDAFDHSVALLMEQYGALQNDSGSEEGSDAKKAK